MEKKPAYEIYLGTDVRIPTMFFDDIREAENAIVKAIADGITDFGIVYNNEGKRVTSYDPTGYHIYRG